MSAANGGRQASALAAGTTIAQQDLQLMAKGFASTTDMAEKKKHHLREISNRLYALPPRDPRQTKAPLTVTSRRRTVHVFERRRRRRGTRCSSGCAPSPNKPVSNMWTAGRTITRCGYTAHAPSKAQGVHTD